jgi:hypothetical protein
MSGRATRSFMQDIGERAVEALPNQPTSAI